MEEGEVVHQGSNEAESKNQVITAQEVEQRVKNQIETDFEKNFVDPSCNAVKSIIDFMNRAMVTDQQKLFFASVMKEAMKRVQLTMKKNLVSSFAANKQLQNKAKQDIKHIDRIAIKVISERLTKRERSH